MDYMEINGTDIAEQVREARRLMGRERERLQEQIDTHNIYLKLLDQYESLQVENERLKNELEQQRAENSSLHQQLDDKDMKLNELGKFSVNVAKKSSQEGLEKAFRIYINTSKRKTQAKREVARLQLLDFIATAKLEMPEDIMELLNHLDDEQPESAPMTNVTVQAGGINVQQANTVAK
jgi:predicted RNase H-like nuclease (RuvC/YqgF family)